MIEALALFGGPKTVCTPLPHEVWPPPAHPEEMSELLAQRNRDISIKGRAGPIRRLEDDFLAFLEGRRRYAITMNSGTSALTAAYFALGVKPGVRVVGPVLTFHAALSPVRLLGGEVDLVDIERDTRCIDPRELETAITPQTRVVTVVHQWGHPANLDAILSIVRKYDLKLVEDCSHAHGSEYRGRPVGTFGDAAVFSLQANKAVFAGEGGILVTDDPDLHARATLLGHYRDRSRDELAGTPHARFWVTGFGQKLRMSPLNAIVAIHALKNFPSVREGRHACLNHFRHRLAEVDYVEPPSVGPDVDMGAWYGFKPLMRPDRAPGVPRDTLVRALAAEGVEVTAPSGGILACEPLFAEATDPLSGRVRPAPQLSRCFPVAEHVDSYGLSLPTFYDPEAHLPLIDQYIEAFQKVGRNLDRLAASKGLGVQR
jgi:dTDP-4-amino-4,6-dideoxygalactose transaminase